MVSRTLFRATKSSAHTPLDNFCSVIEPLSSILQIQIQIHHVTYLCTKLAVARFNGLGGDAFTKNATDIRTHRWTDDGPTLVRI